MQAVIENLPIFWSGIRVTLWLVLFSGILSLLLGTLITVMRVSPIPALRGFVMAYVEIVRNMPTTVVFFFAAFVLPQLGFSFSYFTFAVIALTVYYTAFFSEAIRSGLNAVNIGQAEAARAIGLTFLQALRLVIFAQALRCVVPPLINVFIALIKSTAVASAFGVPELLTMMEQLVTAESNAVFPILIATALFYLAITLPAGLLASYIEKRVAFNR